MSALLLEALLNCDQHTHRLSCILFWSYPLGILPTSHDGDNRDSPSWRQTSDVNLLTLGYATTFHKVLASF